MTSRTCRLVKIHVRVFWSLGIYCIFARKRSQNYWTFTCRQCTKTNFVLDLIWSDRKFVTIDREGGDHHEFDIVSDMYQKKKKKKKKKKPETSDQSKTTLQNRILSLHRRFSLPSKHLIIMQNSEIWCSLFYEPNKNYEERSKMTIHDEIQKFKNLYICIFSTVLWTKPWPVEMKIFVLKISTLGLIRTRRLEAKVKAKVKVDLHRTRTLMDEHYQTLLL